MILLIIISLTFFFGVIVASAWSTDKESLHDYAVYLATHEELNVGEFLATIKCESGFNASAIGDHGKSYGIAQIHLPAHSYITKEQALNPFWSLNWMADQWTKGRKGMWTCWQTMGLKYLSQM